MNKNIVDAGTGVVLLVLCLSAFYLTLSFAPPVLRGYPGAAFFPQLILTILIFMSVLLLARSLLRIARERTGNDELNPMSTLSTGGIRPFLVAVIMALALAVSIPIVGFEIACIVYVASLLFYRMRRPRPAVLGAIAVMLILYVLFVLALRVQLPLAFLPRYL